MFMDTHNPALNAVKHGLTARTTILNGEDPAKLDALVDFWLAQYENPAEGSFFFRLVEDCAQADWERIRVNRWYQNILAGIANDLNFWGADDKIDFNLALRYRTTHDRNFTRAFKMLDSNWKAHVAKEERAEKARKMEEEKKQRAAAAKAKEEAKANDGWDPDIPRPDMIYVLNSDTGERYSMDGKEYYPGPPDWVPQKIVPGVFGPLDPSNWYNTMLELKRLGLLKTVRSSDSEPQP